LKQQIIRRLQELERHSFNEPLILLCKTPDGTIETTLEKLEANEDYHFMRIVSGGSGSQNESDRILNTIKGNI